MSLNKTPNGRYKAVMKMAVPVVQTQTINGVSTPAVVRTAYADITLTFDATSTTVERADMLTLLYEIAGGTNAVTSAVKDLQGVY
jgi:hypothetical protein